MTSIAGQLSPSGRSAPMGPAQAILATHRGATYVIWRGQRSRIDPTDRSVTFNLGLDPGVTYPIEISNALFDADAVDGTSCPTGHSGPWDTVAVVAGR